MAEETAINGVAPREDNNDGGSVEVFVDFDDTNASAKAAPSAMAQKIESLEQEKRQLVHENDVVKERLNRLKEEIKGLESDKAELKREVEQSQSDKRALESISARAHNLETEVSRLQHDLVMSSNDVEESGKEIIELRREIGGLKESAARAEVFEKERDLLLERVNEREGEVREIRKVLEENELELERVRREKGEVEGLLERKGREVEELHEELEARERVICGLKERTRGVDLVNGSEEAVVVDGEFREKGLLAGWKVEWPVVAAAVAAAAIGAGAVMCYVRLARER